MSMVILLSIFGPLVAGIVIFALVMFSSFMNKPESEQQTSKGLEPKTVLKLIAKSRVFPVGIHNGWRLYSFLHGSRVWAQNFLVENFNDRKLFYTSFSRMPASTQVVFQTIKDISKTREWKPGVVMCSMVKSHKNDKVNSASPHRYDSSMGQDIILEVVINPRAEGYTEEVTPQQFSRYWNREDNGCCWMLHCSQDRKLSVFFLIQPVEDLDNSHVTILVHYSSLDTQGANYVSSLLASLKDYLTLRKIRFTPFNSIRLPNFNNVQTKDNYLESSTDDENQNPTRQKFSALDAQQQSLVLQMSESILRLRSDSQSGKLSKRKQKRSVSDTDLLSTNNSVSGHDARPRAQTEETPVKVNLCNTQHSQYDAADGESEIKSAEQTAVKSTESSTVSMLSSDESSGHVESSEMSIKDIAPPSSETCDSKVTSLEEEDAGFLSKEPVGDVNANVEDTESDVSSIDTEEIQDESYLTPEKRPSTPSETVKYTTLANQSAADLMALVLRVSNIDLKKTQNQQVETSGGWMFWGLESDVVIFRKIINKSSTTYSFLGKGLIQATPQIVFDAIKNPRTRFTYDESLKKVDVVQTISEKTKIVYFYHELVYMFKKESLDFCVLQNERVDGDKFVLAMQSVDSGLPVPTGTERVQMLPSGWVIEPVTKDNKLYSMATYVMQMDFSPVRSSAERTPIEEMVAKQPLSIEFLRQYLRPAIMLSRSVSGPSSMTRR